jgi:hypothetical protein
VYLIRHAHPLWLIDVCVPHAALRFGRAAFLRSVVSRAVRSPLCARQRRLGWNVSLFGVFRVNASPHSAHSHCQINKPVSVPSRRVYGAT